jgi:hypothetical protein
MTNAAKQAQHRYRQRLERKAIENLADALQNAGKVVGDDFRSESNRRLWVLITAAEMIGGAKDGC